MLENSSDQGGGGVTIRELKKDITEPIEKIVQKLIDNDTKPLFSEYDQLLEIKKLL